MSEDAKKGRKIDERDKATLDKAPQPEILESDDEGSEGTPQTPKAMRQMMAAFMGFSRSSGGSVYHPIFDKFNDGHVDTFLAHSHEEDMERLRAEHRGPIYGFLYAALVVAVLVFLVLYLLPQDPDLLGEILRLAIAFAGGVGGGYGWRAHLDSRRMDR